MKQLFYKFRNLILYGIIGSFTASLDAIVFSILSGYLGVYYLLANCISVLVGITTSFILNRKYNFKVNDKVKQRFLTFLTVGLLGLGLSNILLWIGYDKLGMDMIPTKLFSIVIVVIFQYLLNKFITFRK